MFRVKNTKKWFIEGLELRESKIPGGGIGVFAIREIKKNDLIESAPVIPFHKDLLLDYMETSGTRHLLGEYVYMWENGNVGMCLGYGMMYNHSNTPNAAHKRVFDKEYPRIEFYALKDIQVGDEILHHYAPKMGDLYHNDAGTLEGFPSEGFNRLKELVPGSGIIE